MIYTQEDLEDVDKILRHQGKLLKYKDGYAEPGQKSKADGEIIGYRYKITNLNQIRFIMPFWLRKNYLVQSGEFMVTMPFVSQPAIKVIITKPGIG